jgi:hypothetical protein
MADPVVQEFIEPLDATGKNASGLMGCVMLHVSGTNEDMNWFQFATDYKGNSVRVDWSVDNGMFVVTEADVVKTLLAKGWARPMTAAEIEEINEALKKED